MNKQLIYKTSLIFSCCFIILAAIFLPEYFLTTKSREALNNITPAKESYYKESGAAMARNTSSNLSALERLNLVSDKWDSNKISCSNDEGFLTEIQAISLARQQLEHYYNANIFPLSMNTSYNNWYSWDSRLYKYTDTVFNTYSAYLWVITFTRFDNTETITLIMTESGTIIAAETTAADWKASKLKNVFNKDSTPLLIGDNKVSLVSQSKLQDTGIIATPHTDILANHTQISDAYVITLNDKNNQEDSYIFYQYNKEGVYGIGLIPYTP